MDVENKDAVVFQTCAPELTPIVSEAGMMRFIASFNGNVADNSAVGRRTGLYVDSDEFVRAITEALDAERPHINELLLPIDACEVWRRTGFISAANLRVKGNSERECCSDHGQRKSVKI